MGAYIIYNIYIYIVDRFILLILLYLQYYIYVIHSSSRKYLFMSQECFIQKSISSCRMLFFSQHFPVRPKNILVVYPKILHNLGLKHSILEPLAESHGCLFWSCSSWPFLPEQHTQCQIDSTTKGNKLIFEGLEFLFLFSIMGESVQNAWQLPLCCVPCHCIHPSKCLGNKDQRCESKRGRTQRLKTWMLQIQSKFQTDNIYVSEPPTTPSNLCKLEKKNRTWWFGGKTPLASLLKKERCRKVEDAQGLTV